VTYHQARLGKVRPDLSFILRVYQWHRGFPGKGPAGTGEEEQAQEEEVGSIREPAF